MTMFLASTPAATRPAATAVTTSAWVEETGAPAAETLIPTRSFGSTKTRQAEAMSGLPATVCTTASTMRATMLARMTPPSTEAGRSA